MSVRRSSAGVNMEPSGNLGYCAVLRLNSLLPMALNATTPAMPTGMPIRKFLRESRFCSLLSILSNTLQYPCCLLVPIILNPLYSKQAHNGRLLLPMP